MAYVVESEFKHCGYKCVVIFCDLGHRCGYVGISKRNELYGKDYSDYLDIYKKDIEDKEISGIVPLFIACIDPDERIIIDAYFSCHGGITYAGGGENSTYPINSDLWWFGFDCGHYNDGKDLELALEIFPEKKDLILNRIEIEKRIEATEGILREKEYVEEECRKLAEQLKEFESEKQ